MKPSAFAVAILPLLLGAACSSNLSTGEVDAAVPDDLGVVTNDPDMANGTTDGGVPSCPIYQTRCNGVCIPTSNDPKNCGGCGVTCTGALACSAGKCVSSCLPGLSICNNSCVDLQSDSRYCGNCTTACPSGQGCVAGMCKPSAPLGPAPAACTGGGPPITVNFPSAGKTACAGNLAQTTFTWALCSCANVKVSSSFNTDAFDSTMGPYTPGGLGGGVGINGLLQTSQTVDVGGALWCSAVGGVTASAPLTVRQELHSGGPVSTGTANVNGDAYINGNAKGSPLTIAKTLYQSPGGTTTGVTFATKVSTPVTVPPPCACGASELIPVAGIVAARATNNDNAAIGLDPALYAKASPPQRLDLPCGNYYLNSLTTSGATTIVAHGRTALYIGGDIVSSQPLTITLDPNAELDLFIGGTIKSSAALSIGSPNYPALTRVYVGSATLLAFSASASLACNFYDGTALVKWSAPAEVYGSVFAGDFDSSQSVKIHYDRQVVQAGASCPGPGGGTTPGCSSCKDCGNQACNGGTCGSCTSSDQCCAPLRCYQGTCQLPVG